VKSKFAENWPGKKGLWWAGENFWVEEGKAGINQRWFSNINVLIN